MLKRVLLGLSVALVACVLVSCDGGDGGGGGVGGGGGEGGGDVINCADGLDSDGDGLVDCADPECADAPNCQPGAEDCDNTIDDDGDTFIDCDDSDCDAFALCIPGVEDCDNGLDDDADTVTDCADVDSCPDTDPNCDDGPAENCNTAEDDDGDGEANCDDDDCNDWPACEPVPDEICDNGIDDDFDNGVDCADSDCAGQPACPTILENCCNGIDDDGNTLTDFQEAANVCDPTNTDSALPSGGDTFPDICDNCPDKKNATQQDNDQDGVGNSCDNCSGDYNPEQTDADDDTYGAACDCDDTNADINPDTVWYQDTDGDGFGDDATAVPGCESPGADFVVEGGDCDDTNDAANPDATEVCDGVDNDCDGQVDEEGTPATWYVDADGDTFGDGGAMTISQCLQPVGYVLNDDDCDDTKSAINPDADEVCDAADNDCDGLTDEAGAVDGTLYYTDGDDDGYGAVGDGGVRYCSDPGGLTSATADDCNDAVATINPGAMEACNGVDDDCNGVVPANEDNADGDAFRVCSGDCNDGNAAIYPGATEVCNGIDDNCAGGVDDGLVFTTYYPDTDGDGFGSDMGSSLCANPGAGFVTVGGDCNDANAAIKPGATEGCNDGIDTDCDGNTSDGCVGGTENTNAKCQNGFDDDGDGFSDGGDYDCNGKKCGGGNVEWQDCGSGQVPLLCDAPGTC